MALFRHAPHHGDTPPLQAYFLLAFFVRSVLSIVRAILLQLDSIWIVPLVLHRRVVLPLANGANKIDLITHDYFFLPADSVGTFKSASDKSWFGAGFPAPNLYSLSKTIYSLIATTTPAPTV